MIDKPFEKAIKSLRSALAGADLTITAELDLAVRTRSALALTIPPCVVLFVSSSGWEAGEFAADPCAASLTPLHVVVSARGSRSEVHVLKNLLHLEGLADHPALAPLARLEAAICGAIDTVGMRDLQV